MFWLFVLGFILTVAWLIAAIEQHRSKKLIVVLSICAGLLLTVIAYVLWLIYCLNKLQLQF